MERKLRRGIGRGDGSETWSTQLITLLVLTSSSSLVTGCGYTITSTCIGPNVLEVWNFRHVSHHLKEWMHSIEPDVDGLKFADSFPDSGGKFARYQQVEGELLLSSVGNLDCSNLTSCPKPVGNYWTVPRHFSIFPFHDGFLYGKVNDTEGSLTGDNVTFVYPDMNTVLVGKFVNGVMVEARESKIIGERCYRGLKEIMVAPMPIEQSSPVYKYERPSSIRMGHEPTLMDPLERNTIYVGASKAVGDGVFAKRDINTLDLISYYSGNILHGSPFVANQTEAEIHDHQRNLIRLHGQGEVHINVPKTYWGIDKYRATLGHKFNHSFKEFNAAYGWAFHPRFGNVMCVVAIQDIKRNEEIFVNYGYKCGVSKAPPWYDDLHLEEYGNPCSATD